MTMYSKKLIVKRSAGPDVDAPVTANHKEAEDSDFLNDSDDSELAKIDCHEKASSQSFDEGCLECDKVLKANGTPQSQFRPSYLIVSDFAKQHWCEMQLLYSFAPEVALLRAVPGEEVKLEETDAAKEAKGKGTNIHMERELEIQVPVEVVVETKEDSWAVKLINLQQAVLAFSKGQTVAREVPVFGRPFSNPMFVYGVIDELRYDPATHTVEISELKTRRSHSQPKRGQQEKDKYQVSLYAQLFNELVEGKVHKEMVAAHLGLDLTMTLGRDVMKHVDGVTVRTCDSTEAFTVGDLLTTVLCQVQSMCCIKRSRVEYIHQDDRSEILVLDWPLDSDALSRTVAHHCQWWSGTRSTAGVDIEDCWKCEFCQFSPLCEWRDYMAHKLSRDKK